MTLEEACRLIDPATDLDALAEIEYYNGFKGKDAAAKALHEASQMVVDFVRQMSWHDAKNPPIAHEESWESLSIPAAAVWWLRSPNYNNINNNNFCAVSSSGAADYNNANNAYGVVPGFCNAWSHGVAIGERRP